MAASLHPASAPLLVLDFDETLVDSDSSEWVAEQLGAGALFDELRQQQGMPWHHAMNVVLQTLHSRGVSIAHIREALSRLPLASETLSALRAAHSLGFELRILSDANTFFIESTLARHGVDMLFSQIHSNPAWIDAIGCLRYDDLHGQALPPHNCPLCPPNMCKGAILERIRAPAPNPAKFQVIYAGDGTGDLCPALRLNDQDCVLPRKDYPLSKLLVQHEVKARVHPWTNLHDALFECVNSNGCDRLPYPDHISSLLKHPSDRRKFEVSAAVAYDRLDRCMGSCPVRKIVFGSLRQRRVLLATSQSSSSPRSLHIHVVNRMFTTHIRASSSHRRAGRLLPIFRAGSCSAGHSSCGSLGSYGIS